MLSCRAQVPDVARVELQADDAALVVASDGLWDVVSDQEAADIVQEVVQVRRPADTRQRRMRGAAGLQVRRAPAAAFA
jgi:serine/threonine protein phosphatase PrpC